MAIDLEKIKRKLKQIQSKNDKRNLLFKPKPGQTTIRILPYKRTPDNPFIELYFHWDFNGKTILSPISYGKADPINEFAQKLMKTGSKEDWKLGKLFEAKMRTFVPIIVRGEEKEGVKYWGFGIGIYEELMALIADPEYGDITDPITGTDIVITRKTPSEAGNDYGSTSIRAKRTSSELTNDPKLLEQFLVNQPDIMDSYTKYSYEELKNKLKIYLDDSINNEKAEKEPTHATQTDSKYSDANSTNTDEALERFRESLTIAK